MPLDPEIRDYLDGLAALAQPPAWEQPLADVRRGVREMTAALPRMEVGEVKEVSLAGPGGRLPLRVYHPRAARDGRLLIVFFHGGGFVMGDLETHDHTCRRLCEESGATVIGVEYRLAPEARFPAAAEDAIHAADWALASSAELGADPAKVFLMGDSAGGNLAAVAALATRGAAAPPAGQVLVYPVTDLRDIPDYSSRFDYAAGFGLSQEAMEWFCDCYAPDPWQREDPRASPLLADLRGAPPALILTAECDPLTSEGEAYARKLAAAGVDVEYHCQAGANHGVLTNGLGWQAGERLWERILAWLRARS